MAKAGTKQQRELPTDGIGWALWNMRKGMVEDGKWFRELVAHTRKAIELSHQAQSQLGAARFNLNVAHGEDVEIADYQNVRSIIDSAYTQARDSARSGESLLLKLFLQIHDAAQEQGMAQTQSETKLALVARKGVRRG